MKRFILIILSILTLATFEGKAQRDFRNGYIITSANDTIFGQVEYRSNAKNYQSCIFKKDNVITEYSEKQLNGFGYENDKFFTSKIIEGSFVEALVVGEMSLYKFQNIFLVRKAGGEVYRLESKNTGVNDEGMEKMKEDTKWKGIISYLMYDCFPESNQIVKDLRLVEKDLTTLIIRYNNCKRTTFKDFKKNKPWSKVDLGVSAGVIQSTVNMIDLTLKYYYLANSYKSVDPSLGFVLVFHSPRISDNLAIQPEVYITNSNYSSLTTNTPVNSYYPQKYDLHFHMTTLSFPVSVKYSFPNRKYSFFLQGGLNYDFNILTDSKLIRSTEQNIVLENATAFYINRSQLGAWGGVGVLRKFKWFDLCANIRYNYLMTYLNETSGFFARSNRIGFSIIVFKK